MDYSVKDLILKSLVNVLKPPKKLEKLESPEKNNEILVDYVQQAASAKTIGILVKLSNQIAEQLLSVSHFFIFLFINLSFLKYWNKNIWNQLQVVHNLLYTMGNEEYADSQRQASKTLEVYLIILGGILQMYVFNCIFF